MPHEVRDGDATFHPDAVLWLELPSGFLLGVTASDPRDPVAFTDTLVEALANPPEGLPRPARIRVPQESLAVAVRGVVGPATQVVVAPVPELDVVFEEFLESVEPEAPLHSYLGEGEISPLAVGRLFDAAASYFRAAPWRFVSERQLVRVDIPQFAIEGACLSVIGGVGESFGLLMFASQAAFDEFIETPPEVPDEDIEESDPDSETSMRSLSFNGRKDLPPSMLAEIEEHRWKVAGSKGYPTIFILGRQRRLKRTTEKDVRIMSACAAAFTAFFEQHADLFQRDGETMAEETFVQDGVSVKLTGPVSAAVEPVFDPADVDSAVQRMDFELTRDIATFALNRFGDEWAGPAVKDLMVDEAGLPLFLSWMTWTASAGGVHVADIFLEEMGEELSSDQIDWIGAQRAAWLSIWKVVRVEAGERLTLRDLLTDESRIVEEKRASQVLGEGDVILARVIDFHGQSLFAGVFETALISPLGTEVVRRVRAELDAMVKPIAVERLREPMMGRFMIELWQETLDA